MSGGFFFLHGAYSALRKRLCGQRQCAHCTTAAIRNGACTHLASPRSSQSKRTSYLPRSAPRQRNSITISACHPLTRHLTSQDDYSDTMRLSSFVAPALATVAAAAATADQKPAEAYILRSKLPSPDASASIPHELAEAVLLQRLSTNDRSYPLGSFPDTISAEDAVSVVSQLGKPSLPLFQQLGRDQPHQLVIEFSGVTADNYEHVKSAILRVPLAFTSDQRLSLQAASNVKKCAFGPSISMARTDCWEGNTQYLRYDATKVCRLVSQKWHNTCLHQQLGAH